MSARVWLVVVLLSLAPAGAALAQEPPDAPPAPEADDQEVPLQRYPRSVTPPRGTEYPCEFTAIPARLPGVAAEHAPWVEHACAVMVKAIHVKLSLLEVMRTGEKRKVKGLHRAYERTVKEALRALRGPTPPEPLVAFRDDLVAALDLQLAFFDEAVSRFESQPHPAGYNAIWQIAPGREASQRLLAAWSKIEALYRGWPKATHDSVYHHLCALDLF